MQVILNVFPLDVLPISLFNWKLCEIVLLYVFEQRVCVRVDLIS